MTEEKQMDTALTVAGNSDLGRKLIEAALETHRSDAQKKVVESVKQLLSAIDEQEGYIDAARRSIAVLNLRLEKLKKGQFTISRKGELVLDDKDLAPMGLDK